MAERKIYKMSEIRAIARELLHYLKPKGMMICELRKVFKAATEMLDYISYGEPVFESDPDEAE